MLGSSSSSSINLLGFAVEAVLVWWWCLFFSVSFFVDLDFGVCIYVWIWDLSFDLYCWLISSILYIPS